MAAKIKKLSINKMENYIEENYTNECEVEWYGEKIVIKKFVGLSDVVEIVTNVANTCFYSSDSSYHPEVKDFATKSFILEKYTNINLPSNMDKRYDVIYKSGIYDFVIEYIDTKQLEEIIDAIEEKIIYISDLNTEAVHKQINEAYAGIMNIYNQMANLFDGISSDDIKNMASSIIGTKLDEGKLVEAYMKNKDGD